MHSAAPVWTSLSTVGRYQLLREIARGGMAVLYLARDLGIEGFEKLVVIKRMLPELAAREDMLAMFLDEARIGALLEHANLPHTYELVHESGEYFFAMEYLHGADVRRLAKAAAEHGGVPLEHAISIAIGLSAGLHYTHERRATDGSPLGLVHRDVSPRNVFVTYDGGVKLLDFGIAKTAHKRTKTRTGAVRGTLQYMSPEQVHAGRVDRRSDVFAASIVLWELTVGRGLFTGGSDYSVMAAIADGEPPAPSTVRPDYPAALEAIVMKGLRRAPAERFQTAEELQLALEQFAREHRLATSPVGLARFMRELFRERVEAYHLAREHGTLTAQALEEVSTWSRDREPAIDTPQADPERPPRETRRLGSRAARRGRRSWLALGAITAVLGAGIAWWQWPSAPAAAPTAAPPPAAAPTSAVESAPAAPPQPPPVATAPPAPPKPRPPHPIATKPHLGSGHHESKPPHSPGSKPLTNEDLDAAFPPK
jgi:serine/threonine protein kinase